MADINYDDEGDAVTLPGVNSTWDYMKSKGLPLTGEQYLMLAFGDTPASWRVGPEDMIDVPREIRGEVERIRILVEAPPSCLAIAPDRPVDLAEIALRITSDAKAREMPH